MRPRKTVRSCVSIAFAAATAALAAGSARADEGGLGFWVPGFFGSLSATPQTPGFAFGLVYYHGSVEGGGDVAFARQVTRGRITANFTSSLDVNLAGRADLILAAPGYTFAEPLFGGQANVTVAIPFGRSRAEVDATLTGALGPIGFTRSGAASDAITGIGDLAPMFSLRWNSGVHNYMTYITGSITTGRYDPDRLVNLGLGHNALDVGGAYTYFDPHAGNEFSATLGFTYNFENEFTQYKNGIDMHLDVSASKFVTKQLQVGLVGYAYQQITCDSGAGNRLGCFEGRVLGIGPQIGYVIPMGSLQGYVNLKAYREFEEEHRAAGWNAWVTFAISAAGEPPPATKTPLVRK